MEPFPSPLLTSAAPRARSTARHGQGGFTLVEVLVGMAVLSILFVAIGAITISGTSRMVDDTVGRHLDATSAQFVALTFARDVQGASGLSATTCTGSGLGTALITFKSSEDSTLVTYSDRTATLGHELVRASCTASATLISSSVIARELKVAPSVSCSSPGCVTSGTPPRTVTLQATRSDKFSFGTAGSRRSTALATVPAVVPAQLFAIGGTTPLTISGNGNLSVIGNAFVNSSASGAITMSGSNARLTVSGTLKMLTGATCSGCNATKVSPFPVGTFPQALPDPLQYLPAPNETGMATGSCAANICQPGIYAARLSLTSSTTLKPGTYIFRKGLAISGNGSITGTNVLLFNGCGLNAPPNCASTESTFSVSGQAGLSLTPMSSGTYANVLVYQSRTNTSTLSISGGSNLQSLSGVLYAPSSTSVALGAGGGGMQLGAVVGKNLSVAGNGTVTINGA